MSTLQNQPVRPRRRLPAPRLSADPDTRSIQIGVLGTILVHLLLFLTVPYLLKMEPVEMLARPPVPPQFDIELAEDEFEQTSEEPPPSRFVEVNPDAPDNVPDKTVNFGAQNQQAAQEEPSPETGNDRPAMEGRTDLESNQIVSGQLVPDEPYQPPAPQVDEMIGEQALLAPKLEQMPLPGFEKMEGEATDSYGSNIAKFAENSSPVPEKVDGTRDVPLIQGATGLTPQIDPLNPRPAPRLERRARPAIFSENRIGTANIGPVAFDAKWSNYGQYLQQLIEAVQVQWERILTQSRNYPPRGTTVTVKFRLNTQGQVASIIDVRSEFGSEQAKSICVSAITDRAPYGEWTEDMITVLGESQELTFTFYYM